jgi:hypothetical protein
LAIIEGAEFNGQVAMKKEESNVIELELKAQEMG